MPLAQTEQQEPDMSSLSAESLQADAEVTPPPVVSEPPSALRQIKLLSLEKLISFTVTKGKEATCQLLADPGTRNAADDLFEKVDSVSANFAYIACVEVSPFTRDVQSFNSMMMHANDTKVTHIFVGAWCNPPVEAAEVPVESADLELRQLKALEYETQLSDALGFASCMIWLPPSHDSYSGMASLEASSVLARQLPVHAAEPLTSEQRKLQIFGEFVPWPCGLDIATRRLRLLSCLTFLGVLINIALLCGCAFGLQCARCSEASFKFSRDMLAERGVTLMEDKFCLDSSHQERLWIFPLVGLIVALTWPLTYGKDLLGEYLLARQAKSVLAIMSGRRTYCSSRPQIHLLGNLPWTRLRDEGDALIFSRVMASVQKHAGQECAAVDESTFAFSAYVAALIHGNAVAGKSIHNWMGERGLQLSKTTTQGAVSLAQLDACLWPNGKAKRPFAVATFHLVVAAIFAVYAYGMAAGFVIGFVSTAPSKAAGSIASALSAIQVVAVVVGAVLGAALVHCGCFDGLFYHLRSQRTTHGVLLLSPVGTVELRGAEASISSAHLRHHECLRPDAGVLPILIYLLFPIQFFLNLWTPGAPGLWVVTSSFIFVRQLVDTFDVCAFGIELWRVKRRNAVFELPTIVGSYGLLSIFWAWCSILTLNVPTIFKLGVLGPVNAALAAAKWSEPVSAVQMIFSCFACMKWAYMSVLVAVPTRRNASRLGPQYAWRGRDADLSILLS
jgi:hypothetical protein